MSRFRNVSFIICNKIFFSTSFGLRSELSTSIFSFVLVASASCLDVGTGVVASPSSLVVIVSNEIEV